jgi:hypothetical protein
LPAACAGTVILRLSIRFHLVSTPGFPADQDSYEFFAKSTRYLEGTPKCRVDNIHRKPRIVWGNRWDIILNSESR